MPLFHDVEREKYAETCQLADGRYQELSTDLTYPPNELEVQQESGIYYYLMGLPSPHKYMPNGANRKLETKYTMYGRPTIEYLLSCGKPFSEALEAQKALNDGADVKMINEYFWLGA